MNQSPLFDLYVSRVARTGEYHGWTAAETVSSTQEEYLATRNDIACVDSSFRGRLTVAGKDGLDLLHRLSTNDLRGLRPGGSLSTILTTEKGRIIDFVTVCQGVDKLMLIVSPMMEEAVTSWIGKFIFLEDVSIRTVTSGTTMVSFIGPEVDSLIISLPQVHTLKDSVVSLSWGDIEVIPVRLSHSTEIHLVTQAANAERFWNWLEGSCGVTVAKGHGETGHRIPLAGSSAYEAYRIAEGIPMTGSELIQSYNPYEVNLRQFISYTKGCYIGQEVIARLDTYQKARRQMAGLIFEPGAEAVRPGVRVFAGSGEAGVVTSSTGEPLFGSRLGLAVMRSEAIVDGAAVTCKSEGAEAKATVRALPMRWPG